MASLHDTLADEPVPHLGLGPGRVGSVLGIVVVGLHGVQELVSGSGLRVGDTVFDEPLVEGRSRPSLIQGSSCLEVGDSNIVEESRSASWLRGRNNIVLLQPSSKLVVVPSGKDVVLGVIELPGCFVGSVSGLRRECLVTRRSLAVGGRDRLGSLVGRVTVDGGRSSRCPNRQLTYPGEGI